MSRTFRNRHNRGDFVYWLRPYDFGWMPGTFSHFDERWAKSHRLIHCDGRLHDNGHKHYKEASDAERRVYERVFLMKVKKGYDLDNVPYPCEKEQKHIAWDVW